MTTQESRKTQVRQALEKCRREYARSKTRIEALGFICEGSLVVRWMACGKPNCVCRTDTTKRHGPYYQLSWKEKGKTISRRLAPEAAQLYREWQDNRQLLDSILAEMYAVSGKVRSLLLPKATTRTTIKQARRQPRTASSTSPNPWDITIPRA